MELVLSETLDLISAERSPNLICTYCYCFMMHSSLQSSAAGTSPVDSAKHCVCNTKALHLLQSTAFLAVSGITFCSLEQQVSGSLATLLLSRY